jgi:hypothetical protein
MPCEGIEPFVFMSYAYDDGGMVYKEFKRFHDAGCNIWYDEGIDASESGQRLLLRLLLIVRYLSFLLCLNQQTSLIVEMKSTCLLKRENFSLLYIWQEPNCPLASVCARAIFKPFFAIISLLTDTK